uniref:Uncharacterized protein n=1 Tax=viral metagenome TaxID=1070528 RepID=A0A6M3KI32_9ZZZZ
MATKEKWAKVFHSYHQYKDNVPIYFGDAQDASIAWDGSELDITAATVNLAGAVTLDGGLDIGTVATGIDFTGTYTGNVIDFSSSTHVPTGSNGPGLIRAGTYGTPITNTSEDQSGLVRLYMETSADGSSYDRGVFVCLKTTGIKGIFPIAGLAEVLAQSGNGPTKVQAAQFICDLHTTDAKLAALGGDATAGMYGGWFKITAIDGATIASGARAAPIWIDNQLYGANAATIGEEYGIFATTGGSQPKAFIGFETSSSGYKNFLYFDETSYDQDPIVSADLTGSTKKYLKVDFNGTAYGIHLWSVA